VKVSDGRSSINVARHGTCRESATLKTCHRHDTTCWRHVQHSSLVCLLVLSNAMMNPLDLQQQASQQTLITMSIIQTKAKSEAGPASDDRRSTVPLTNSQPYCIKQVPEPTKSVSLHQHAIADQPLASCMKRMMMIACSSINMPREK
jgi:hypothetical protein